MLDKAVVRKILSAQPLDKSNLFFSLKKIEGCSQEIIICLFDKKLYSNRFCFMELRNLFFFNG